MLNHKDTIDPKLMAHDQAVRMMATWISAIADQVKNPVAGISAAATLIEKQMASFRAAEAWDPSIVEEAVKLMIKRLSRFDNYLSELSGFTRDVNLDLKAWTLQGEWNTLEQAIVRRVPVDFRIIIDTQSQLPIYADFERVTSILAALSINSVEACGTAVQPVIEISLSEFTDESCGQRGMILRVEDNGPGFSDQALLEGLVPFFTTKDAGTGLGLAMVEKYVRAHGGWVKLNNKIIEGKACGAVVELFFPAP
jgi:nitrogen fixation/metabolism regulation signal transduction histidine kinase